jgi:hypothetical protein
LHSAQSLFLEAPAGDADPHWHALVEHVSPAFAENWPAGQAMQDWNGAADD